MRNETSGNGRIEFLQRKLEENRAALTAEMAKKARREQRETDKEERLLGAAVRKAGAESPDFRLMIAQTALSNITDEKARQFLAEKGWF